MQKKTTTLMFSNLPRLVLAVRLSAVVCTPLLFALYLRNVRGTLSIRYSDAWLWVFAVISIWHALIFPVAILAGKFLVSLIGRSHRQWQRHLKSPCVTVDGKIHYSRYISIEEGVLVAPRKGYDSDAIERDRLAACDEFNAPLCSTVSYHGWLRRLGFRYLYVRDHTSKPVRRSSKSLRAKDGSHVIGIQQDGSPLTIDLWCTPMTVVGGTSGAGKSSVLRNVFGPLLESEVQVNLVDLTGQYDRIGGIDELPQVVALIESLAAETRARQSLLKQHGVTRIEMLPPDVRPKRILTVIDEAQLLFDLALASDSSKATDEQRSYAYLQKSFTNLISASRKTGIVFVLGLTDPLQSRLGIRLANAANRIAVDCVTAGVSESLLGDPSAADPSLRNGRVLVRSPGYNGIGRVFQVPDEL